MILIGLGAIAVLTQPAWLLLHPYFSFPFHRLGERIGMIALLCVFWIFARRLGVSDRTSLGYGGPRPKFLREISIGLIIGVATMSVVVGIMTALGLLEWTASGTVGAAAFAGLVVKRLLSALSVALIEETFLRGGIR